MKALTCEMCGSTNILKQDGVFVCQSCGTKYSVEEAKKMMVEGTVDVKGTVKIDTSSELKNLYEIARRAKDTDNSENALKYYDMILVKDPSSWEANFYVVYYRAMTCKIGEIQSAAISVNNALKAVFELIKTNVPEEDRLKVATEIHFKLSILSSMLFNGATNHYRGIDYNIRYEYTQEWLYNVAAATDLLYDLGDKLVEYIGDEAGIYAASSWEQAIEQHKQYVGQLQMKKENQDQMIEYATKARKYHPDTEIPNFKTTNSVTNTGNQSNGGCYIATAVYGSYDCPEVWTLRRFRDFTLAGTWYGRAFIKIYYTTSPTLVRWFGKSNWFKQIAIIPLNRLIKHLHNKGVIDSPYNDRIF